MLHTLQKLILLSLFYTESHWSSRKDVWDHSHRAWKRTVEISRFGSMGCWREGPVGRFSQSYELQTSPHAGSCRYVFKHAGRVLSYVTHSSPVTNHSLSMVWPRPEVQNTKIMSGLGPDLEILLHWENRPLFQCICWLEWMRLKTDFKDAAWGWDRAESTRLEKNRQVGERLPRSGIKHSGATDQARQGVSSDAVTA